LKNAILLQHLILEEGLHHLAQLGTGFFDLMVGGLAALDNVSFEVKKGEFVFITGPSGAGKTTILKMILGELVPDSGEVIVDGTDVRTIDSKKRPYFRRWKALCLRARGNGNLRRLRHVGFSRFY